MVATATARRACRTVSAQTSAMATSTTAVTIDVSSRLGPTTTPTANSTSAGMLASSCLEARVATLTAVTVATRSVTKYGTRSASYDPTGRLMVTSCFHPSATPANSASRPGPVGRTPLACPGTAAGTPASVNAATVAIATTTSGRRRTAPTRATSVPKTIAVTAATIIESSR